MKNFIYYLVIVLIVFLVGCTNNNKLIAKDIALWAVDSLEIVDETNIVLPKKHPDYQADIIWESDDSDFIDIVNLKLFPAEVDQEITLRCKVVYKGGVYLHSTKVKIEAINLEKIASSFIGQFNNSINRNYNVWTHVNQYGGTSISWSSSNQEVFTNEGKYIAPFYDTEFEINYTLNTTQPQMSQSFTKKFVARKMADSQRQKLINTWIENHIGEVVSNDYKLPLNCDKYNVSLTWYDTNRILINSLADVSTYIIPNVGVDLIVQVTTEDTIFETVVRVQSEERSLESNMRIIPSIELVKEMRVGWNLGNTFDAPSELAWGNPKTTKAMIDKVKEAGFNVIRIPVTWDGHFNLNDFLIDEDWISRYQSIVNYAIDDKTFVILNMHHERWNSTTYKNQEKASQIMEKLWTQIGLRFGEYDEHLIFEGMNEPRIYEGTDSVQWTGTSESFAVINHLNSVFVNTVRNLGGNNKYRHLMITTNGAGTSESIIKSLIVPKDPYVIVSVHSYAPYNFAHDKTKVTSWSKLNPSDTQPIDSVMTRLYNTFIKNDIAVIMGEFATRDKNNLESRLEWLEYYLTRATKNNIVCLWWDTGQVKTDANMTFSIFNRRTLEWIFPEIVDGLLEFSKRQ